MNIGDWNIYSSGKIDMNNGAYSLCFAYIKIYRCVCM